MDLLRNMSANRQVQGLTLQMEKVSIEKKGREKTEGVPGSKAMRYYIIEKKPGKKVVKEHLEAIISQECESSSDSD